MTSKHLISDYQKPYYKVPHVNLSFELNKTSTVVTAQYTIIPVNLNNITDLVLNGDITIELLKVTCNRVSVPYKIKTDTEHSDLIIEASIVKKMLPQTNQFVLTVECQICPEKNTSLSGLYISNNVFCTQCESHGFRRIIYSFDRPDILSQYTVKIISDPMICPVVLSNGNMIDQSSGLSKDKQVTIWEDPHPKPSYLFALVAGNLGFIESKFITKSNKNVKLRIYAEYNKITQLSLAMESIIKAMKWDEIKFGLEYDLSQFNIVCLDDFNMGAMENKGLNIFNSKYILASPETATDMDADAVCGVIGHEYFHNWTGNRVTLEKWFDLTLKEGLTVYRDQTFSRDVGVSPVHYIIDRATDLRNGQFIEDLGPNAHPIRPSSYIVMDNFYTSTVYEKGAEIIRIYETLLGVDGFRKGMDLYFKRHDGTAVACEDFYKAMYDANTITQLELSKYSQPMSRLFNWYHQPGTPHINITFAWNNKTHQMHIKCSQTNPKCKELLGKYDPVLIPIKMGLIDKVSGKPVIPTNVQVVNSSDTRIPNDYSFVLDFYELEQEFILNDVSSPVIPSFMRDFSAPVFSSYEMSLEDRQFLLAHDTNQYNRWEQSQYIHKYYIKALYDSKPIDLNPYIDMLVNILKDDSDIYLKDYLLTLPLQDDMYSVIPECDPVKLYESATSKINHMIASKSIDYLEAKTVQLISVLKSKVYERTDEQINMRQLLRTVISFRLLVSDNRSDYLKYIYEYYQNLTNFTEISNLINVLVRTPDHMHDIYPVLEKILDNLAEKYKGDSLMSAKWLRFVSNIYSPQTVELLSKLYTGQHKNSSLINKKTPNHLYAMVRSFTINPYAHQLIKKDSEYLAPGYEYITYCILDIDSYNPQVASTIADFFAQIKFLSPKHQKCMRHYIKQILSKSDLSENTKEIMADYLNN
jgi:aminopeptidase N